MHCLSARQIFERFKEKVKFITMVKEFKVNKCTIIFKINIAKTFKIKIDKFPKLMKSSVTLNFLKIYIKDIKEISDENPTEFN